MRYIYIYLAVCMLYSQVIIAQTPSPLLTGRVEISIKEGTLECEFMLSDMPAIKDYVVRLNTGMNLKCIRNTEDNYSYYFQKIYDDSTADESFGYYIPNKTGKFMPQGLRFSYTGKFPVVTDTIRPPRQDWKGNIAFNGYSVRADGRQSAWYPVLYDIKNDKAYSAVRTDVEVVCKDCNTIYINGNAPLAGPSSHIKNARPWELMLFAGDYKVANVNGTYFLNPDMSDVQMKQFGEMTNGIKQFYEAKLKIPYGEQITFIHTTPVSKDNAWMFVSYPTIVNIGRAGYGLKDFIEEGSENAGFIAHELGHYYFGTRQVFNSETGDLMSEGFAEYLSLQAIRKLFPDSVYRKNIQAKLDNLKDFQPVAISSIKGVSDYKDRDLYAYSYTPLLLTAIEKEIGIEQMWRWMQSMVEEQVSLTNYSFLEQALSRIIKNEGKMKLIKENYFSSGQSLENTRNRIGGK
jgi:hypothetical protein